jgi:hypothetical protein
VLETDIMVIDVHMLMVYHVILKLSSIFLTYVLVISQVAVMKTNQMTASIWVELEYEICVQTVNLKNKVKLDS